VLALPVPLNDTDATRTYLANINPPKKALIVLTDPLKKFTARASQVRTLIGTTERTESAIR